MTRNGWRRKATLFALLCQLVAVFVDFVKEWFDGSGTD